MNILSLFDGMSGGQLALNRAGVQYNKYYASEIDKYAIKITQKNYPKTIQVGDITNLNISELDYIDMVIGGSPCQNLSRTVINNINHNQGLKGEKSSLFYDYVRVLRDVQKYNPDVLFLLENVGSMSENDKDIITETLGVKPIRINSNLVSAQDRDRYYWTNIKVKGEPEDKNVVLKDIMLTTEELSKMDFGRMKVWYDNDFEYHGSDKKVIATLDINGHDILKRVYNPNGKCATLTTCNGGNLQKKVLQDNRVRKLVPLEYERLQTVPDNYTEGVSNTQRYNLLGNGWTIDVIAWIFSFI